ncbi:MAG TPA: lipid-binding protein [Chitinophagaceae bacterium]
MKLIKYSLALLMSAFILNACTKDPEIENTSTVEMAGEWWVKYYIGGAEIPGLGYLKFTTYNTSDPNSGQVWVDDGHLWPLKAKFDVDYSNLAFKSMASTPNTEVANGTVKVMEGKILKGAGLSLTGNVVDSIFLRLEFSDDPGNVYEIKGHHDTGFFADHP